MNGYRGYWPSRESELLMEEFAHPFEHDCSSGQFFLRDSGGYVTLSEIASWALGRNAVPSGLPTLRVVLPALQRGAVWKPIQVELLWDSIFRGFPVGSFLISPYKKDRGIQKFKYQYKDQEEGQDAVPTHYLVDGQQRANAIALGFLDPWSTPPPEPPIGLLWLDLDAPPENDEREFIFRVVTRAHPWGYAQSRSKEGERLSAQQVRKAVKDFKDASPEYRDKRPHEIPLTHVWPTDAIAPVPVPLLLAAARSPADPIEELRKALGLLPFCPKPDVEGAPGPVPAVLRALEGTDAKWRDRLEFVLDCARNVQQNYEIPVIVYEENGAFAKKTIEPSADDENGSEGTPPEDPLETLFSRLNTRGTPLQGEELLYSVLKSAWPQAPKFVEALRHRLVAPSRCVVLTARLVLATGRRTQSEHPPQAPDVARFRRLMHGLDRECPEFLRNLVAFVDGEDAPGVQVFHAARRLLSEGPNALPPVLAAELGHAAPDVLFLFLRWLHRMLMARYDIGKLDDQTQRRLLGVLTAVWWFSVDAKSCVDALWPLLEACSKKDLPGFFNRDNMAATLRPRSQGRLRMLPLVPPEELKKAIQDCVTSARGDWGGFGDADSDYWKTWSWDENMCRLTGSLQSWFNAVMGSPSEGTVPDDQWPWESHQQAWQMFVTRLRDRREILLYAQRDWLRRWFPHFDPTLPDQLEDLNRPWDFDHIHPKTYVKGDERSRRNIPPVVKAWHRSIGNLRAWPFEANRSTGMTSPAEKLAEATPIDEQYSMKSGDEIRSASFISDDDWEHWQKAVPEQDGGWLPANYLAKPDKYGRQRQKLVLAITKRFVRIYRHWYETLGIADWMPQSPDHQS